MTFDRRKLKTAMPKNSCEKTYDAGGFKLSCLTAPLHVAPLTVPFRYTVRAPSTSYELTDPVKQQHDVCPLAANV